MKATVLFFSILALSSFSLANEQTESVVHVQVDYTCVHKGQGFQGSVALKDDLLQSDYGLMTLGVNQTIGFKLIRNIRVNDIYLVLRDVHDRNENNFISLIQLNHQHVSLIYTDFSAKIKHGLFRKSTELQCLLNSTYLN